MSIQIRHCITIVCDSCGKDPSDFNDEGMTPHFDNLDEAHRYFEAEDDETGWHMTPTEHICPRCRAERACATVGHEWDDWRPTNARGVPMVVRLCWRCSDHELAMPEAAS